VTPLQLRYTTRNKRLEKDYTMNNKTLKAPILTQLYRIVSVIAFLLAFVVLVGGIKNEIPMPGLLPVVGAFVMAAIFALGIAEVIYLIAKIEFNTRDKGHEYQVTKLLSRIAANTEKSNKDIL